MKYAVEGRLTKHALATPLTRRTETRLPRRLRGDREALHRRLRGREAIPVSRRDARWKEKCVSNRLLRAGTHYHKACAAEWIKLYGDRTNRADRAARQAVSVNDRWEVRKEKHAVVRNSRARLVSIQSQTGCFLLLRPAQWRSAQFMLRRVMESSMTTMKAVVFKGKDHLAVEDVPRPHPRARARRSSASRPRRSAVPTCTSCAASIRSSPV